VTFDPRAYVAARIAETRPRRAWAPDVDFPFWQVALRNELAVCIGLPDAMDRVPLDARITETVRMPGHLRERVEFTTRPGLTAMGYMLIPDNIPPRQPAVLCLPGHGPGVDSVVGILPIDYSANFPLQCVERGYPTFAIEQISFGHRRDAEAQKAGGGASSCNRDSTAALMFGESMTAWRVWDAMRALDYLQTRPEVDPNRLITMGISGGGLTSLFTAALDTRVAAAVVSGYLNTFADSVLSINHCVDNYAPGLRNLCEMADIAGLITPRLLFAESGAKDHIFPLAAFEKAVAQVSACYATVSASDRFGHEVFDDGHCFHGVGAFAFLEAHLNT
jgi:dienelactone hydrolase